ncbi:hypothetical protein [Carboxylicivirga marina]|uniref:hypothetical protein n=1 Tax=Carboxylicivirga marina TaxID=2800988 RepID=UPI00259779DD|nr:hypothetical protein [uncultured Carboxylicivirga sp.]
MRVIIIFISALIILACEPSKKEKVQFESYQYPSDSLRKPKVFVYHRLDNPDKKRRVVRHVYDKNDTTFLIKYSIGEQVRDSSIFIETNGNINLHERHKIFTIESNSSSMTVEGNILERYDNGADSKTTIEFDDINNPNIIVRIEGQSTFDSTLVFNLKGTLIPSIRYQEKTKVLITHRLDSTIIKSIETEGETFFGKGMGMICLKSKDVSKNRIDTWELEMINDYLDK